MNVFCIAILGHNGSFIENFLGFVFSVFFLSCYCGTQTAWQLNLLRYWIVV